MIPPIPLLEDYEISPHYGFLPMELPLEVLPDPYYNRWEAVIRNLQPLLLSRRLRGVIDRLPVLSTSRLQHSAEWRRAYHVLAFITHAYIWGGDKPEEVGVFTVVKCKRHADTSCREYRHQSRFLSYKSANTLKYLQSQHTPASVSGTSSLSFPTSPSIPSTTYPHLPHLPARSMNHGSILSPWPSKREAHPYYR